MRNLDLLEMEVQIGGTAVQFFDGVACGVGVGLLFSGAFSLIGAVLTGYGCARALELI